MYCSISCSRAREVALLVVAAQQRPVGLLRRHQRCASHRSTRLTSRTTVRPSRVLELDAVDERVQQPAQADARRVVVAPARAAGRRAVERADLGRDRAVADREAHGDVDLGASLALEQRRRARAGGPPGSRPSGRGARASPPRTRRATDRKSRSRGSTSVTASSPTLPRLRRAPRRRPAPPRGGFLAALARPRSSRGVACERRRRRSVNPAATLGDLADRRR